MSSYKLSEVAIDLVTNQVRNTIAAKLVEVQVDRGFAVSLEPPPTTSYFNYPKAHGYRCPAIFVVDAGMDFRLDAKQSNYINSALKAFCSVKVEDKDLDALTRKAWRYQAALAKCLHEVMLANSDNTVRLNVKVRSIAPSDIYTIKPEEPGDMASFFKEYRLELAIDHFEQM